MKYSHQFFSNRDCAYFPCHAEPDASEFNCLFCYCPLYALGEGCGGNFRYNEKGYKVCTDCSFPHRKESYEKILARYPELAQLAARKEAPAGDEA